MNQSLAIDTTVKNLAQLTISKCIDAWLIRSNIKIKRSEVSQYISDNMPKLYYELKCLKESIDSIKQKETILNIDKFSKITLLFFETLTNTGKLPYINVKLLDWSEWFALDTIVLYMLGRQS